MTMSDRGYRLYGGMTFVVCATLLGMESIKLFIKWFLRNHKTASIEIDGVHAYVPMGVAACSVLIATLICVVIAIRVTKPLLKAPSHFIANPWEEQ